MGKVVYCMLCGKEGRADPAAPSEQHYYLCPACAKFWLSDYLRRVKARLIAWLPWIFVVALAAVLIGALRLGLSW